MRTRCGNLQCTLNVFLTLNLGKIVLKTHGTLAEFPYTVEYKRRYFQVPVQKANHID